ncbi:MAG: hypothetical protein IJH25_04780 [Clostridia bacterium]|nr:hypothetical protein [Clostridia bacterium]MBQ6121418.1 hypothetical protein [Clostridia bacterium]
MDEEILRGRRTHAANAAISPFEMQWFIPTDDRQIARSFVVRTEQSQVFCFTQTTYYLQISVTTLF